MSLRDTITKNVRRRTSAASFALLLIAVLLFGWGVTVQQGYFHEERNALRFFVFGPTEMSLLESATSTEAVVTEEVTVAEPKLLRIEKLGIEAPFVPVGINEDGSVSVPETFHEVGWYEHGPRPGEKGPAVILGHVDSVAGPAVFFYLGQLEAGDEVEVELSDGTVARFAVESLERYEQSAFPTELVYSDLEYPGIRLITCSGIYEKGKQRYTHNLVVYGRMIEDQVDISL